MHATDNTAGPPHLSVTESRGEGCECRNDRVVCCCLHCLFQSFAGGAAGTPITVMTARAVDEGPHGTTRVRSPTGVGVRPLSLTLRAFEIGVAR